MFPPSADYALELSRPPNLRSDDPLYHRLRTALICVVNIWLFFQQNLHNVEIACVLPRDNSLPSLACLYGCHPSFFTIFRPGPHHASDRNDEGLDGGIWKLSQKVRRAILTNNTCHTFCLVFADVVQKLLKEIGGVVMVDIHTAAMLPHEVYFWESEIGQETGLWHEFLVITMRTGKDENQKDITRRYVLDAPGYQFGFPDFFYEYDDYFDRYVNPSVTHPAKHFGQELEILSLAAIEEEDEDAKACLHLRDLLSETTVEELREFEKLDY